MQYGQDVLNQYVAELCEDVKSAYSIDPRQFEHYNIKRGLRNADGTGVLAGVTAIGSVQGYQMVDGEPEPIPGKLYYRGIGVEKLVGSALKEKRFGFEEAA